MLWKDFITSREYAAAPNPLVVPLGKTESGEDVVVDLYLLRNLLIGGVADSGKTMLVHSILNWLLARNSPNELQLIIVDPKQVEYQSYDSVLHLLTPVISDPKKAVLALKWMGKESQRRLGVLAKAKMRSIEAYHEKIVKPARTKKPDVMPESMPFIVMVIDELSLVKAHYPREVNAGIAAVVQTSRATGIHLIVTTTRLDVTTVPVPLREHFSARIAFHMPAAQARLLVGTGAAESLTEAGAAIYRGSPMAKPLKIQTPHISEMEIDANLETVARMYPAEVIDNELVPAELYWQGKQTSIFSAMDEDDSDDRYAEAVEAVKESGKASTSYLQRKLGIGYSRAARLIDLLEEHGVIGPGNGAEPRELL